jgi:hypothetical protein
MTVEQTPLEIIENKDGEITHVEYHNATIDFLYALSRDESAPYLSRSLGAAGLVRFCLDRPPSQRTMEHVAATTWVSRHLLDVRGGRIVNGVTALPQYLNSSKPTTVVGHMDELTMAGTGLNRPQEFREMLQDTIPSVDTALIIALGHGGILSAADTHLAGAGEAFYPVRYSLRKRGDTQPFLSDSERSHLKELSRDRTVILLDEDCSAMMTTLCSGTEFFATLLEKKVYGASPTHVSRFGTFSPAIISSDTEMLRGPHRPGYWGGNKIG